MKNYSFFLLVGISIFWGSCSKNNTEPTAIDYKNVLNNLGNDVILSTYAELDTKTQSLVTALTNLEKTPTAANLETARQSWRDARVPWEQSEGFLFGPVDQQGIDPAIDSWPVNQPDLDAVLASPNTLTKAYIDGLDGTLKGFHTIEYLVFGVNGNKQFNSFNARQFEYLRACAQSLAGATQQLYYAWKPDQKNFITNVINAGVTGNTVYPSQKAALEEVINGLVTIADEVANGKINDPLSQQNINLEESRFSSNSKNDFANNIRSIKNAYVGIYKNTLGVGISNIIVSKNATLDTKVKQQLEDAIKAIEAIEGTFTTAIFNAKPSVLNAQIKVRTLQQTLESEVLPIISNL
jgi:putative iron-regulated protein